MWNISGGDPPNISEEGLLWCGKPKLDWPWLRNPSLLTLGFLGPLSCCTASLFMLLSKHFFSLQARHWFRCVLSMGHFPFRSAEALQVYTRPLWIDRLKKPEQPEYHSGEKLSNFGEVRRL